MPNPNLAYLESNRLWPDFHSTFLNYWRESIADQLPSEYEARLGEQVTLVRSGEASRRLGPDISIVRSQSNEYSVDAELNTATAVVLDHLEIEEEIRTTHIELLRRRDKRLVTVLELLSPSNKEDPGWSRYLTKRSELLAQPIHLIELDLLLMGNRLPHRQALPKGEYFCFVSRVETRQQCLVTSWQGSSRMPTIAIPLLAPDSDLASSLQSVFETAFSRGRYVP